MLLRFYNFIQKFIPFEEYIHPDKLCNAINDSNTSQVKECLEQNYNVNKKFDLRNTPFQASNFSYLHQASHLTFNSKKIIKLLLDAGADIEAKDSKGYTPLIHAIIQGNFETIELLINKGSNIYADDNHQTTPLLWAIQRDYEIAKFLLRHGALKSIDIRPLNIVAKFYQANITNHKDLADMANWLIAYKASLITAILYTPFIGLHQLKMTFNDCTDNQVIKFTSIAKIAFESGKALENLSNFHTAAQEAIVNVICVIDLINATTNNLNSLNRIIFNNRVEGMPPETLQQALIRYGFIGTPPTLNIASLYAFIEKELKEAKSPKQTHYILQEIKQMVLSLENLKQLPSTIQESFNKLIEIDTKNIIQKAKDTLGDAKARYLANQGQKTKALELKYNLPDPALSKVAAFAPNYYAIATAAKKALPQICSKIFETDTTSSYITEMIGHMALEFIGKDVLADIYDI